MAKLHNYYVLCPLIDQKSFLGVAEDKESEFVLITLGRNVVNKYRLSDQKQIGGWTSKDHITSAVIYDIEQASYVGVFNKNTIKIWKEDSDNLDKIKKYRFPINILKLIPRGEQTSLIIFANGNCASLPYALENRKTYENKILVKDNDTIVDVQYYNQDNVDYVTYVTKNSKEVYEIINCPLREELGDLERAKLSKVKIFRNADVYVVGELIYLTSVYVLWSDAKMTVYDVFKKTWTTIGTVPWISTLSGVSIAWMGKDHLILFGSNADQDGAIIVAFNILLGVGSCRYPMKMYSEGAKLYCYDNRIILEASNHIGMLPFVLETKRNLSSLLGSHEIIQDETTEIADWDSPTTYEFHVDDDIKELLNLGLTERSTCSQVIPPLLEKDDYRKVYKLIKEFKDVPESVLVMLLNYAIKLVNPSNIDITNTEEFAEFCSGENKKKLVQKFELLNYVFQIPFSDALVIPHLRNGLSLNNALFLLTYISFVLTDSQQEMHMDEETKLFDWCTLLMDAFYQQFVITKDQKVTYVLKNSLDVVQFLINQLNSVNDLIPVLTKILSGKEIENNEESLSYSIELMEI